VCLEKESRDRRQKDDDTGRIVPAASDVDPSISFVLPTKNEEEGIEDCIEMIKRAVGDIGVVGEILVSDSSTDRTPEIATEKGAIVVNPDRPGYGYAYRYAFNRARGELLVMGDGDTTYDFSEVPHLVDRIEHGDADIVMGSRFEGEIKPGAMPSLHQHVGNPLLTKFLNVFYEAGVSDAHSGLRVFTRDALEKLRLRSVGMEFASEMVMEAGTNGLRIEEVPITYHPREGEAELDSFRDGWRHVKFMLENAPSYLFAVPGIVLAGTGLLLMFLSFFDIQPGVVTFGTHTTILGSLLTVLGFQTSSLAVFSAVATEPIRQPQDQVTNWLQENFRLEQGATFGSLLFLMGAAYSGYLFVQWATNGYTPFAVVPMDMIAFTAIVIGIQIVFSSFHLSSLAEGK
jgi:glycosyltransferase involved in cell wall biosynthesis